MFKKHVVCAVSGGVDSAVAAYLLLKQGYKVTGCFMKNWDRQNENNDLNVTNTCQADLDKEDAKYVCDKLNIKFIDFNFTKEYWNNVFSYFLKEYELGLTPNPDILCNKYIKFPLFYKFCKQKFYDLDYIATGHYARVDFDNIFKRYRLLKSIDEIKDQTFFLSQLDSSILKNVLFPIGSLEKNRVREIANEIGLDRIAKKRSSVGICFIGKRDFKNFIDQYIPEKPGKIIDIDTNNILDEHKGVHHYTIGQRISFKNKRDDYPYYVVKKDVKNQNLFIAKGTDHPSLYYNEFYLSQPHWISENFEEKFINSNENIVEILGSDIKFRFQQKHKEAEILYLKRIKQVDQVKYLIKTKYPFRGITSGQFIVFYNKEECIGSAKIIDTPLSLFDLNYKGLIVNTDKLLRKNYFNNEKK